jgi:hypothetical protein
MSEHWAIPYMTELDDITDAVLWLIASQIPMDPDIRDAVYRDLWSLYE